MRVENGCSLVSRIKAIKGKWCGRCGYGAFCERTNRGGCMLLLQILNVAAGALMIASVLVLTGKVVGAVTFKEKATGLPFLLYSLYLVWVVNEGIREYLQEALG